VVGRCRQSSWRQKGPRALSTGWHWPRAEGFAVDVQCTSKYVELQYSSVPLMFSERLANSSPITFGTQCSTQCLCQSQQLGRVLHPPIQFSTLLLCATVLYYTATRYSTVQYCIALSTPMHFSRVEVQVAVSPGLLGVPRSFGTAPASIQKADHQWHQRVTSLYNTVHTPVRGLPCSMHCRELAYGTPRSPPVGALDSAIQHSTALHATQYSTILDDTYGTVL